MAKKTKGTKYERTKTINGKVRHFYGATKREVQQKIDAALMKAVRDQEKAALFETVAAAWWCDKQSSVKYGSLKSYKPRYEQLVGWFSGYRMDEITPAMIAAKLRQMQRQGNAGKTISKTKSILNMIFFYWCAEMGGNKNPVALVKLETRGSGNRRKAPPDDVVAALLAHPEGFGLLANIAMLSGLRLGEIIGLRVGDIDLAGHSILVSRAVVWRCNTPVLDTPKTENSMRRTVYLPELHEPLASAIAGRRACEYLFGDEQPLTKSAFENAWLQYCKTLGLAEPRGVSYKTGKFAKEGRALRKDVWRATVTPHQLRHEYASQLVHRGISEAVLAQMMGHTDPLTAKRWYVEAKPAMVDTAEQLLYGLAQLSEKTEK